MALRPTCLASCSPTAYNATTSHTITQVMVMAGKDRGQVGTVVKVIRDPRFPRVVVEGLNLVRGAEGGGSGMG